MSDRDPYIVLGVAPVATADEIKKVYRALSKEFHPDINQEIAVAAQDKMKECTAAYQIVSNRTKREDYDQQPHFKPRSPKGFAASLPTRAFLEKPVEKGPGLLEKLLGLFVKVEAPPKKDLTAARTHFTMGLTLTEQEAFYADAREEFARAMKADPDFLEAAYNYGLMSYKVGLFEDARVGFQKVTRIKPNDQFSRLMLDLLRPVDSL